METINTILILSQLVFSKRFTLCHCDTFAKRKTMRLGTYLIIMLLLGSVSCKDTEKIQVPQSVAATFLAKYPIEVDPEWKLDKNGLWEAHFKIDDSKYRADFLPNGLWVETELSIKKSDLPPAILTTIKQDFNSENIVEIEQVMHHGKGLFYDVEFQHKGKKKDVEFREDGSLVE